MPTDVRYAPSGDAQIAYRVLGHGPPVVWLGGTIPAVLATEQPLMQPHFDGITAFASLIVHDPRGTGRSDPLLPGCVPTPDDQAADVIAVLNHIGIDRANLFAIHAGGAPAVALATAYPERVESVLFANCWSRMLAADDYPFGIDPDTSEQLIELHRQNFGTGIFGEMFNPSRGRDEAVRAMYAALEAGLGRSQAVLLTRGAQELDVRSRLGDVQSATVVMHSRDNTAVSIEHGRYLARHIPGATFVDFAGTDHAFFLGNNEPVRAELEQLVTGRRRGRSSDRRFATILFSDLVDSTARAATLGDGAWRTLLDRHDALVNGAVRDHGGRVVKSTGDGALAEFAMPSTAIAAGRTIIMATRRIGIESRVGVHAGEVEGRGEDVGGIAVNLAARVCSAAQPGTVTVTSTVRDLLAGSGTAFIDRGEHALKGVSENWHLYEAEQ